ncbi:MAG TPA: discoidin domain-containing protein [Verrucomicrobiae bacterium]|nr:discoidin domain-containing protein [Verrucomicrobiae bacterium]
MRKKIITTPSSSTTPVADGLDVGAIATVLVTSELTGHPVENAFDGQRGPGSTRWVSEIGGEQTLNLAFDAPQTIRTVGLEIEETEESRTQELQLAISLDGEKTYRELLRQEFHFSPGGSTFEREEWTINAEGVTHLRLQIKPDKGGRPCRASVTSLVLR